LLGWLTNQFFPCSDEENKKDEEQTTADSCLDDVQVLTEFNKEDEPKLSFHLGGGIFQGNNHQHMK